LIWKERVVRLNLAELKDTLFIQEFTGFHKTIEDTTGDFRRTLRMSENLADFWHFSYLGAAVEGKIAANAYWYVRFIRENGKWKVWCLEEIAR